MRALFDLEKAQFSEGSDQEIQLPSKQNLELYNQQYYLVLTEAKNFFTDCKQAISRLISIKTAQFGLNTSLVLTMFLGMENKLINGKKSSVQQSESVKAKKQKYQQTFYSILQKMSDIVDDLLNLEVEIKKSYMGPRVQKHSKRTRNLISFNSNERASFFSEESKNSSQFIKRSIKRKIIEEEQQMQVQSQDKIRGILKNNLQIESTNTVQICQTQLSSRENLDQLAKKFQIIAEKMKTQKEKQFRAWQNFNKKKMSVTQSTKPMTKRENRSRESNNINILDEISFDIDEMKSIVTKQTKDRRLSEMFGT